MVTQYREGSEDGAAADVVVMAPREAVATIEIHRPPDNYLDARLVHRVADAVDQLEHDEDCRSFVLASAGRNFCAGARLGAGGPETDPAEVYRAAVRLFTGSKPFVAAVQGAAVGGGLGLALAADFRVAAPTSRLSANFSRLGFFPGFGITALLPRVVGPQAAMELLYTGARIGGERAYELGLCDRLVNADDVRPAALELAGELAAGAPRSVRRLRRHLRGELPEVVRLATAAELEEQLSMLDTYDFREGVEATAQRRPPRFTGH